MPRKLPGRAIFVSAAVIASLLASASVSDAAGQQLNPTCSGGTQFEWPEWGYEQGNAAGVVSHTGRVSLAIAASVPAGTWVVNTAAYDGDTDRGTDEAQLFEQFFLQFLDSDGAVIQETSDTVDLADSVEEAQWVGPVGTVVLDRPAVQIRAYHAEEGYFNSANSVQPVCVGLDPFEPPTTTTTTEPPVTTTEPPTTTEPATTTVAPTTTTTAAPTTTTVPTNVLGIQQAPPADPVPATPSFTG